MLFNSFVFIFGFLPARPDRLLRDRPLVRRQGGGGRPVARLARVLRVVAAARPADPAVRDRLQLHRRRDHPARARAGDRLPARRRLWLVLGLVVDLGLLGYYKYANFVVDNVAAATGSDFTLHHIVLPLAISFFTFQKIAYLVDTSRGIVKGTGPIEFGLFAAFFPQLLAGPIVHYSEIIPQLRAPTFSRLMTRNLVIGLVIFTLGLAKKTIVADTLASYANPLFLHASAQGWDVTRAWTAAVTYTLQLYMDFSGYSDMAIGLGRMFGVKLPLELPLAAARRVDHRLLAGGGHMTLQRFLLAYVYQPLALPLNRWSATPRLHRLDARSPPGSACRRSSPSS